MCVHPQVQKGRRRPDAAPGPVEPQRPLPDASARLSPGHRLAALEAARLLQLLAGLFTATCSCQRSLVKSLDCLRLLQFSISFKSFYVILSIRIFT